MGAHFFVSYLKLWRAQIILTCFVFSSLLLWGFPAIDINISRVFFDGGFYLREQWWHGLARQGLVYLLCLSMIWIFGSYLLSRISKRTPSRIDGSRVCYLALVLIFGAGLIVNVALKDNFGRARPRDVVEFGGTKRFTPAFVVSSECETNCSFSSGEGAAGFFFMALARTLSRRRTVLLAAAGFGILMSASRIAAGAHFFSDTVVSFFVMLIVMDVLNHYIILRRLERKASTLQPAFETAIPTRWPFRRPPLVARAPTLANSPGMLDQSNR